MIRKITVLLCRVRAQVVVDATGYSVLERRWGLGQRGAGDREEKEFSGMWELRVASLAGKREREEADVAACFWPVAAPFTR